MKWVVASWLPTVGDSKVIGIGQGGHINYTLWSQILVYSISLNRLDVTYNYVVFTSKREERWKGKKLQTMVSLTVMSSADGFLSKLSALTSFKDISFSISNTLVLFSRFWSVRLRTANILMATPISLKLCNEKRVWRCRGLGTHCYSFLSFLQ